MRLARTPDGRRIEVGRTIDAPREAVWTVFRDTDRWPEWGPSVRAVECPTRYVSRGTTGRVRTALGPWLPFEVRSCADYRWTWDVSGLPATGHRVDPIAGVEETEACRAVFEVPPLAAGYVPVCRRALGKIARLSEDMTDDSR